MSLNIITPVESGFIYNPKVMEICLISGLRFCLSQDFTEFQIDQNQFGEPQLVPINKMEQTGNYSTISLNVNFKDSNLDFRIINNHNCDKWIYEIIDGVNSKKNIPLRIENDTDKVEIYFRKGLLHKIYIYKYNGYDLLDTLTIIGEGENLFLIRQNPWKKIIIKKISVFENKIKCELEFENFNFILKVNDFILNIITRLLSTQ